MGDFSLFFPSMFPKPAGVSAPGNPAPMPPVRSRYPLQSPLSARPSDYPIDLMLKESDREQHSFDLGVPDNFLEAGDIDKGVPSDFYEAGRIKRKAR
jgi:hypothetical protein